MTNSNSANPITNRLLSEIREALESVDYGSIEIFIQNKTVTQITVRNIKKTSVEIKNSSSGVHIHTQNSSSSVKIENHQDSVYRRKSVRVEE